MSASTPSCRWGCAVGKPEQAIHKAILRYLELVFRGKAVIHHSPNEAPLSSRDPKGAAIAMNNAKAMGMQPGFPDLVVFPFSHVGPLFFEVKAPKGKLTPMQAEVIERLIELGYRAAVVRSVDDVAARLAEWGVWAAPAAVSVPFRGQIDA